MALSAIAALSAMVGCSYDDTALWREMEQVKDRVSSLEEAVIKTNEDIVALQTIVDALQKNLYVVSVTPTTEGYTILFSDNTSATITNGKDGANAPIISVREDEDGNYYWTIDGEWLLVDGERIRANGLDGENGANGAKGEDATLPRCASTSPTLKRWVDDTDSPSLVTLPTMMLP